jgi:threonine dehydratase
VNTLLVPLSGGGLLAGIAVAVKTRRPDLHLVGVSMDRGAVMAASLQHGAPVEMDEVSTLADSLQGGIGTTNDTTFPIVRALVDDVVLVTEDRIWEAMRAASDHHRLVLEGAGAVGIAALLGGQVDGDVVVVCSVANAEPEHVAALARAAPAPPSHASTREGVKA